MNPMPEHGPPSPDVRRVMEVLQEGRMCTPDTCPYCRADAERIVEAV